MNIHISHSMSATVSEDTQCHVKMPNAEAVFWIRDALERGLQPLTWTDTFDDKSFLQLSTV